MNQITHLSIFAREALIMLEANPGAVLRKVTTWRPIVGSEQVAQVAISIAENKYDGLWLGSPGIIDELYRTGMVSPTGRDQYQMTLSAQQALKEVAK